VVIPLPHPSGASSWVHQSENKILLERGINLIGEALAPAGHDPNRR
jgi:hypothetical protein